MMRIKLKTTKEQDKENWLDVSVAWTVSRFKDEIFTQLGFPSIEQRLVYHGRILKDDNVLRDLEIKDGDLVILVLQKVKAFPMPDSQPARGRAPAAAPEANGQAPGDIVSQFQHLSQSFGSAGVQEGNLDSLASLEALLSRSSGPDVRELQQQMMQRPELLAELQSMLRAVNPALVGEPRGNPSVPRLTRAEARAEYAPQRTQMMEMGFPNDEENLTLLIKANGNIEIALSMKLE